MQTFEYSIELSTKETLHILEISLEAIDDWSKKAFTDLDAARVIHGVLSLCTKVPHSVLEEAKYGYTKPLERLLKTPPVGALMKIDRPVCLNINDCAMANRQRCTTRSHGFPECWDYSMGDCDELTDSMLSAQEAVKAIVMAWRDNRYAIISD